MKVYSFPTRVAGTNIFVSHINDIQSAINYLSTELTNGIGSVDTPRVFKVAAAATGYASFNVPPAGGTPSAPASGDLWNDAGTLKFYNGTATKSVAFTDTVGGGSGDVSSNTSTSVDSEVVLFSGTGGKTVKRATISGLAKLTSGVLSAATAGTDYAAAAHTHAISDVTGLQTALDLKAALASPTFTGTPAAPTAAVDTNTTQVATTAYVVGQGYLKSATASSTYAAISHTHAISDVTNLQTNLDLKAALASPTFTGTPAAPTAAADTNTTQIATTAYVVGQGYLKSAVASSTYAALSHSHAISDVTNLQSSLDLKAALASPTFTGTPAAPTATADTNTTQLATTAFVVGQASSTTPVVDGTAAVGTSLKYARADHVHPTDTSRAASSHTHAIADVTNLQTSLDGKAATSHTHAASDVTSGTFDITRIPTGSTSTTVSLGNHTHALDDLSDVTLTSVTTDQVLKWNGTAWVNGTVSGGGGIGSLGSNGLVVQTATTPTYAARTITGTSNEIEVTNGDGVAGNPTIGLPDSVAIATALTLAGKTINTSTGVGVLASWAVKSYTGTSVTTTTTSLVTTTLTLVNNIVYDVIAYAGAQGNAPSGGFIDLLVDIGTAADETGSRAGTASGERPIFAFDMQTITGTGSAITIAMKGKTTTGTGSVSSGILIAIAFPRGPVMS